MTIHRKKPKTFSGVANARWTAYAAAGAASAVVCASSAEAVIHVVDVNEAFSAAPGKSTRGFYSLANGSAAIEVAHNLNSSSSRGHAFFALLGYGGSKNNVGFNGFTGNGYAYVSKLAAGADIAALPFLLASGGKASSTLSARGTLANGPGFTNSQFLKQGQGYIGFEFNQGAGEQYGWASVTMDGAPGNSFTLNDYAYGDPGDILLAGGTVAVPEPGPLALLATGGAGLLAWRKRRALSAKNTLPG